MGGPTHVDRTQVPLILPAQTAFSCAAARSVKPSAFSCSATRQTLATSIELSALQGILCFSLAISAENHARCIALLGSCRIFGWMYTRLFDALIARHMTWHFMLEKP